MSMDMKLFVTVMLMFAMTYYCSALLTACANNGDCTADQANSECDTVTDTDGNGDGECKCVSGYSDDGAGGCTGKGVSMSPMTMMYVCAFAATFFANKFLMTH